MTEANMIETKTEQNGGPENEIAVSVYCLAYNHEKYIRDALESFVSQKTTFQYEVIVHDDASTDGTADIIREYAQNYPEIIRPIYQKENQYSKGVKVAGEIIWPLLRGKYVAACECDDCWTDPMKLQLQYDAMEKNPDCTICSHSTRWIEMESGKTGGFFPAEKYKLKEGIVDKAVQMDVSLYDLFHLSSLFMRRTVYDEMRGNTPAYMRAMPVGDVAMLLYFQQYGQMYFVDREMSLYRRGTEGSWTKRVIRNQKNAIRYFERYKEGMTLYREVYEGVNQEAVEQKIADCSLGIAAQKKDYKTLRKNMSYVYRIGGIKWAIKVMVCAACPLADRVWERMKAKLD